jgi:hypothetical protein
MNSSWIDVVDLRAGLRVFTPVALDKYSFIPIQVPPSSL